MSTSKPENTGNVQESRDESGRFKPGISGNPAGKPKGSKNKFSFVQYWQERWEANPKEFKEMATEFLKDEKLRGLIIQMVDGRPQQDVTSGGEKIPTPILHVLSNDSHQEDQPPQETD